MKSSGFTSLARAGLLTLFSWASLGDGSTALAQTVHPEPGRSASLISGDQPPPEAQAADAQIGIVRARAFLGLGDYDNARAEAEIVLARDPNSADAIKILAAVEEATGRWRQAARHWARAAELTGDSAAASRRDALVGAHPSYVGITGFFEGAPGVDQLSGLRADYIRRPLDGPEWTAMLEHRTGSSDAVTRLDGAIAPADESRQRLDIGLADDLPFARVGVGITVTEEAVGARVSIGHSRPNGSFELTAGYDEPYWAYTAGLVNDATYKHVAVSFSYSSGLLSLRGRIAGNDYDVRDESSVARSIAGAVGVDYALGGDVNAPRITYIIDVEQFDSIDLRTRADSTQYAVMPFADRTVHTLGAYKRFGEQDQSFMTLGAGYRRDSETGAEGAYASFVGEVDIGNELRLGARLEYSDVSTRGFSNEPYAFAELYVRRQF